MPNVDITERLKKRFHYTSFKEGVVVHLEAHPAPDQTGFELFFNVTLGEEVVFLLKTDGRIEDEAELPTLIQGWEFEYTEDEESSGGDFMIIRPGVKAWTTGYIDNMRPFLGTREFSPEELASRANCVAERKLAAHS